MAYNFLIEKYEKHHPKPQWLDELCPSKGPSGFYILWMTKKRKVKLAIIVSICILSVVYSLYKLLT